jgi:hypothetical protein
MADTIKAHCNDCGASRNHVVLCADQNRWTEYDQDGDPVWHETALYEMLKCCGCDHVTMRLTEDGPWQDALQVRYFPPSLSKKPPKWLHQLKFMTGDHGKYIGSLLQQIYAAFQNDLNALAVMGVRALMEFIMISQSGDQGTFPKNLATFKETGHVSDKQAEHLKAILEVGHAAIHRGHLPEASEVSTVIDIAENVIESVFVHESSVDRLKSSTPKRT